MNLRQHAICRYQDPHEHIKGYKGTIVPECFTDHPQMVEVPWSDVLLVANDLKNMLDKRKVKEILEHEKKHFQNILDKTEASSIKLGVDGKPSREVFLRVAYKLFIEKLEEIGKKLGLDTVKIGKKYS